MSVCVCVYFVQIFLFIRQQKFLLSDKQKTRQGMQNASRERERGRERRKEKNSFLFFFLGKLAGNWVNKIASALYAMALLPPSLSALVSRLSLLASSF